MSQYGSRYLKEFFQVHHHSTKFNVLLDSTWNLQAQADDTSNLKKSYKEFSVPLFSSKKHKTEKETKYAKDLRSNTTEL